MFTYLSSASLHVYQIVHGALIAHFIQRVSNHIEQSHVIINLGYKGTEEFYNIFIKHNTNNIAKWEADLQLLDDNDDNQLIKSMSFVFEITSDTPLRWFQYKKS